MLNHMAVYVRVSVAVGGLLLASACLSSGDVNALEPDGTTTSSSTTTTVATTATTAEETTTSLSELELAEVEVEQVVNEWFFFPVDTSKGEEGIGAEYLTGLMLQRSLELAERVTSAGQIQRRSQASKLEITSTSVDLASGTAEVDTCLGTSDEIVDAETLEVVNVDDPDYLTTSTFVLMLTDGGWKISDLYLTRLTDEPVECEIAS